MDELKPCPFCGRKPTKVRQHHIAGYAGIYYTVECKAPGSACPVKPQTRFFKREDTAIEAWNRRAGDAK